MKLLVIGFGNMGSAIVKALLKAPDKLFEEILVMDHSEGKGRVAQEMGLRVVSDFEPADVVLLAVKPQDIEDVMPKIKADLVISIAAGVSLTRLSNGISSGQVVRVMPNTPALVGTGASGWVAAPQVSADQKSLVKKMLETFGVAIEVKNDDQIDAVTALSGSGPAYVFYFIESLVAGAVELGLSEDEAQKLAVQTVLGGAELAKSAAGAEELIQLRENVTSKGGTTEKALQHLEAGDFKNLITGAMESAYNRAKQL